MTTLDFLPWLRLGLAASIGQGEPTGATATMRPQVEVLADGTVRDTVTGPEILLRGPGDVIALNAAEIKHRDPAAGATGVETNYFCAVEFLAPDLPWRYTPTPVDDEGHLAPWLVLVVVEVSPQTGIEMRTTGGRLPVLSVEDPAAHLPDLTESWAWAHVQVTTPVNGDVAGTLASDPAAFSSRLLCPRRLAADTRYTACVVPAFKAGRLSGLGLPAAPSLDPAWTTGPVELPVYDSWEFTAGDRYDFKSLARLIKPRELPEDVGFRDLDLSDPGPGLPPVRSAVTFVGAMHAPVDALTYWTNAKDEADFAAAVRKQVNEAPAPVEPGEDYDPLVHDPVVAPPAYGAPQVGTRMLPESRNEPGWFEGLNVGPQHRAVAGIGADVVRMDQESLVAAAWEQAREAIEVNRRLNRGRLAQEAASQAQLKWQRLDEATAVSIAAPAFPRLRVGTSAQGTTTASRALADGNAPRAYFGAAFRRLGRPGGPLATLAGVPAARSPAVAIVRAAVVAAKPGAEGVPPSPLSTAFRTRALPAGMDIGVRLADVTVQGAGGPGLGGLAGESLDPGNLDDFAGRALDRRERMELRRRAAGRRFRVVSDAGPIDTDPRPADVIDYSGAIRDLELAPFEYQAVRAAEYGLIVTTEAEQGDVGVDLAAVVKAAVQPVDAVLAAVRSSVLVPNALWPTTAAIPTRVRLKPRFTDPMYERVTALSVDYLVPGIGVMRYNTLGLLEINPAYVEAMLVGLNHEMSRELRWREYPAALGQTWFQRFWDNVDPTDVDIPPIDSWRETMRLGGTTGKGAKPGLVAIIKAALIRRFPDVRVYAVPAMWNDDVREPDPEAEPLGPSFVGTLQKGVNFYGFEDLTEEEARGDGGGAGWFFVLEEEPKTTRFGLDRGLQRDRGENPTSWPNLSWANLAEVEGDVPWFCAIDTVRRIERATLDDLHWGEDAAVMAGITLRRPIQVFLHGSAMLPEPGRTNDV